MGEVIKIHESTDASETTADKLSSSDSTGSHYKHTYTTRLGVADSSGSEFLSVEQLYPNHPGLRHELRVAPVLLNEVIDKLKSALDYLHAGDPISADDRVQQVQALLPELFCCRGLGDGFGIIIDVAHHALLSRAGEPLRVDQITCLTVAMAKLLREPFLSDDVATELVMKLEDTGLNTSPGYLNYLADILDD